MCKQDPACIAHCFEIELPVTMALLVKTASRSSDTHTRNPVVGQKRTINGKGNVTMVGDEDFDVLMVGMAPTIL